MARESTKARAGQGSWWAGLPGLAYLVALVLAPLVIIVIFSFLSRAKLGVGVKWEFTVQPYIDLFYSESLSGERTFDPTYLQIFFNSVLYSLVTAIVCLVLSIPIALWIATRPPKWRTLLVFLVTIPFATIVGLVYSFLPFMILPIYASAERFDFRLAEAAYDLGATKGRVLMRIVIPAVRPGIIAGLILVFIPALGSFLAPELLGGGKTSMIAKVIAAQFGASRNWPFGAALSVMVLVIVMLALVAFAVVARRTSRRGSQQSLESLL